MRLLSILDGLRERGLELRLYGERGGDYDGVFTIPSPIDRAPMRVIASSGGGWEHVSVSRSTRCPNWPEMEHIKHLFFCDDETAMQLHVPPAAHINHHQYCLHIWRPIGVEIPRPPGWMVGPEKAS